MAIICKLEEVLLEFSVYRAATKHHIMLGNARYGKAWSTQMRRESWGGRHGTAEGSEERLNPRSGHKAFTSDVLKLCSL